jgi:hypothetical protein
MLRLGKRGMEDKLTFTLWEVVVIFMVAIALIIAVRGIANDTTYWKKYHSTDLALMTDLVIANQGDFVINYDIKDLESSWATKLLRIDKLVFQIFLKDDSYFIYDTSIDKDRFPQSYIFAQDKEISTTNITSDYIVLYKEGNTIGLKSDYLSPVVSCPSADTKGDLSKKHFDVIPLSDAAKIYSTPINELLKTVGTGQDKELLISIIDNATEPTTIYYDSLSQVKSEKMSCLIMKHLKESSPDVNVKVKPYDKSFEIEPFVSQRTNYMYWVLIEVNTNSTDYKSLTENIRDAIYEYYGQSK